VKILDHYTHYTDFDILEPYLYRAEIKKRLLISYLNDESLEHFRFKFLNQLYEYEMIGVSNPYLSFDGYVNMILDYYFDYRKFFPKSKDYGIYLKKLGISV